MPEQLATDPWADRHPSVRHFQRVLEPNPRLPDHLFAISAEFNGLAMRLLELCEDGPELSTALRKLREAKDCAVLQAVFDEAASGSAG